MRLMEVFLNNLCVFALEDKVDSVSKSITGDSLKLRLFLHCNISDSERTECEVIPYVSCVKFESLTATAYCLNQMLPDAFPCAEGHCFHILFLDLVWCLYLPFQSTIWYQSQATIAMYVH